MEEKTINYKTTLEVLDEYSDPIQINIFLHKKPNGECEAKVFDSKKRYFYAESLTQNYDFYYKLGMLSKLNILYDVFEDSVCVYLNGGGWTDSEGLDENTESCLHLYIAEKELFKYEEKVHDIKKLISSISLNYPLDNSN